jgi:hypothetical protein
MLEYEHPDILYGTFTVLWEIPELCQLDESFGNNGEYQ